MRLQSLAGRMGHLQHRAAHYSMRRLRISSPEVKSRVVGDSVNRNPNGQHLVHAQEVEVEVQVKSSEAALKRATLSRALNTG